MDENQEIQEFLTAPEIAYYVIVHHDMQPSVMVRSTDTYDRVLAEQLFEQCKKAWPDANEVRLQWIDQATYHEIGGRDRYGTVMAWKRGE
jgi:hypothetical protein